MYQGEHFKEFVRFNRDIYEIWLDTTPESERKGKTEEDFAMEQLDKFQHTIGRTKIDKTKRASVISELAEIIFVSPGDEIEYIARGTEIILKKVTSKYMGFDVEGDVIKERMYDYLAMKKLEIDTTHCEGPQGDASSYEEARNEFLKMLKNKK